MSVRVLLVHSAAAIASRLATSLASRLPAGIVPEILTAATGEEALEKAAAQTVNLVVTDLVLPRPGMSGPYTLTRLRELCPQVHTVLLSRYASLESLTQNVADTYLVYVPLQAALTAMK